MLVYEGSVSDKLLEGSDIGNPADMFTVQDSGQIVVLHNVIFFFFRMHLFEFKVTRFTG